MLEVIYEGPVFGSIGYANSCRGYILALDRAGVKVSAQPYNWKMPEAGIPDDIAKRLKELSNNGVARNSPHIQHAIPDLFKRDAISRCNIGLTVFETDGMPKKWPDKCNEFELIVVPCQFNAATFANNGVDKNKLNVVPHVVDTDHYRPDVEPVKIKNKKGFNFLSVFEFSHRKGWDILLEAFWREFKDNEDVSLTLKTYYRHEHEPYRKRVYQELRKFQLEKGFKDRKNVFIYGQIVPEIFMPNFYRSFDCFVVPTRGEGFGLPMAEALACEVPVITTNWSGHLEFCKPNNSFLINVEKLVVIDGKMMTITPNYKGQQWAQPDINHLRKLMRYVYENHGEAQKRAKVGRSLLKSEFSYEAIGKKFKKVIEKACRI